MNEYAVERLLLVLQSLTNEIQLFRETYVANNIEPKDEPQTEPNLILPERMERGEMYEVGDSIVVMNSEDYYDLLCKSWEKDEPQTDCDNCMYLHCNYECAVDEYEPQTNADQHVQRIEYVGNDGRCRCWKCKHFEGMHETPISSDGRYYTYVVCTASKCHYEPKDEPQTEMTTEQIVNELLSIKKILDDGKMPKQTHDIRTETHECVKDTHERSE